MHKLLFVSIFVVFMSVADACLAEEICVDNENADQGLGSQSLLPSSIIPFSLAGHLSLQQDNLRQTEKDGQSLYATDNQNGVSRVMPQQATLNLGISSCGQTSAQALNLDLQSSQKNGKLENTDGQIRQDNQKRAGITNAKQKDSKMAKAIGILGKGLIGTAHVALPAAAMVGGAYLMGQAYNRGYADPSLVLSPNSFGYPVIVGQPVVGYPIIGY